MYVYVCVGVGVGVGVVVVFVVDFSGEITSVHTTDRIYEKPHLYISAELL